MSIALIVTDRDISPLQHSIEAALQGAVPVGIYPEITRPEEVEMAVIWKQPPGALQPFTRLLLVSSLGAGVEHILNDPTLPSTLHITRIVDDSLTLSMRNYVLMAVLNIHKQFRFYQKNQQERLWKKPASIEIPLRIGVLGLGVLGSNIASSLAGLGFEVWGYSQNPKQVAGVRCLHAGHTALPQFAAKINLLVCLLPRTPQTEGILHYELFRHLPKGAFLVNVARGAHLDEPGLLRALAEGYLQEAWLDVFQEEPLPAEHPFWKHPGIVITPHIASVTNQEQAGKIIAENYRRLKAGESLLFEVDRGLGY